MKRREVDIRRSIIKTEKFIHDNDGIWFIKIDLKHAIITLHPKGGKEDQEKFLSQDSPPRENILGPIIIAHLTTKHSLWYGPFCSYAEALGYAHQLSRFYSEGTHIDMPVRPGRIEDYSWRSTFAPL